MTPDGTLPVPARKAAEAAYRNWHIGDEGEGRLHAALLAYERGRGSATEPLTMPQDEFEAVRKVAGRVERDAATARTLISGALLAELGRRVYEYENTITWNTTCTSCAGVLDSAYAETMRREQAEAKLAALRSVLLEGGQDDASVRRRAITIIGTEEEAP